jgi:hypothetical protein
MRTTLPAAAGAVLAGLLVIGPSAVPSAATPPVSEPGTGWYDETTLWDSTTDPHENYHVHGLAVTPADTILAFTEGRHEVCDAGPRDLLLRRSTDGGQSWQPSQVVVPSVDGQSWGNPSPVVDRQTGTVYLFFGLSLQDEGNTTCSGDRQELYLVSSDDDGQTWTEPVELPELFAGNEYGWTLHGPGPGHGIQLSGGRLLLPVLHRREVVGHTLPERLYGVSLIYSDDHGESWQVGEPIPVDVDYPINESRVVERADGTVVVNGRSAAGGTRHRITAVSTDQGTSWSEPVLDAATGTFVAVDAGMVRYPGKDGTSRVLYSNPDSSRRENMTVSVSYDEGYTYRYRKTINAGPSYYSDLAVLSDGTILLLYGRDGEILGAPQRVAVARFDLAWLTAGRDSDATGPGLTEHDVELGTPVARTWPPARPALVTDDNARGGLAMRYQAGRPGDYVAIPFWVRRSGEYEVAVRHHRAADRGRIQVSLDGTDLPSGLLDPTLASNQAYQVYQHGTATLDKGLHWIRFTLVGEGYLGGTTIAPDHLTLIAGGGPHELLGDAVVDDTSVGAFSIESGAWGRSTGQPGHPYYGVSYRSAPAGTGDRGGPVATGRAGHRHLPGAGLVRLPPEPGLHRPVHRPPRRRLHHRPG